MVRATSSRTSLLEAPAARTPAAAGRCRGRRRCAPRATSRRSKSASVNPPPPSLSRHSMAAKTSPRRKRGSRAPTGTAPRARRRSGNGSPGSRRSDCSWLPPSRRSPARSRAGADRRGAGVLGEVAGHQPGGRPRRRIQIRTGRSRPTSRRAWAGRGAKQVVERRAEVGGSSDRPSAERVRRATSEIGLVRQMLSEGGFWHGRGTLARGPAGLNRPRTAPARRRIGRKPAHGPPLPADTHGESHLHADPPRGRTHGQGTQATGRPAGRRPDHHARGSRAGGRRAEEDGAR